MALRTRRSAINRGSLEVIPHQNSSVICVQNNQLPIQTGIDVLRRHSFQVRGQLELDTDTFQTVAKDLPCRVEVTGEPVHVGGCAVPIGYNKDKSGIPVFSSEYF